MASSTLLGIIPRSLVIFPAGRQIDDFSKLLVSIQDLLRFDRLIDHFELAYFVFLLETIQTTLTSANVHHWSVAGFALYGRLGNKKSPVRPWIKCLHRLKALVFPAKSPAAPILRIC